MTKRFLVPISTVSLGVTGLLGAVQPSRYVGSTASGAPTSGDFLVGDWIVARVGGIYVCTTAGSPGTWTQASAAADLSNYVTLNGTQTVSGAKTFSTVVKGVTPVAPTDLVTKAYADLHGVYASPTPPADPTQWGLWMDTSA